MAGQRRLSSAGVSCRWCPTLHRSQACPVRNEPPDRLFPYELRGGKPPEAISPVFGVLLMEVPSAEVDFGGGILRGTRRGSLYVTVRYGWKMPSPTSNKGILFYIEHLALLSTDNIDLGREVGSYERDGNSLSIRNKSESHK